MTTAPFRGQEPGSTAAPTIPPHPEHGREEVAYTYHDAAGRPLFYVCRYAFLNKQGEPDKTFLQGRPSDNAAGWTWRLRPVEPVLYRLPAVIEHLRRNDEHEPLYLVEGEKDAERLQAWLIAQGLKGTATCNPMGAGKWRDSYTETLRGCRWVVAIGDNDEAGHAHLRKLRDELGPTVGRLDTYLPAVDHPHADISDHVDSGLDLDELVPFRPEGETPAELAEGPLLMAVADFVALQVEPPPPLWGTPEVGLIVQGGLAVFAGRPATGKTTLVIDLACHLAAGKPWPPRDEETRRAPEAWPVPRPLRIAIIEGEGPLEMFRDKLKRKLDVFPHPLTSDGGYLGIQTWRWGGFSFADDDAFMKAAVEFDELNIDLVIGDPLNMLGVEGVGSPAETRAFVQRLRMLGLGTTRAFLLIHHFRERVEHHEDELRKLSGAWGGHIDSLITLAATQAPNEVRLAFPKLRWCKVEEPRPTVLGKVYNLAGFEAIGLEDDVSMLEPKLVDALNGLRDAGDGYGNKGWQTSRNLAQRIHASKMDVPKVLEAAPHIFALRAGQLAKDLGAKSTAKLWGLRVWDDAPDPDSGGEVIDFQQRLTAEASEQAELSAPEDAGPSDDDLGWR